MRAGKAEALALAGPGSLPLRAVQPLFLLDPVDALGQAVAVHHQVVVGEGGRLEEIGAPHGQRIEPHLARHLIEQALESEAHIDRAVAAERPARRRVGEHALAEVLDVVQVVDGVQHRARIQDRHHAVARVRAAALDALALHARDLAALRQPDLQADVGLGPAAMGDERVLAVDDHAHGAADPARQQSGDQLHVEALGAAAEAAADERLHHADARHVHAEDLRQHQVHVVGHLRGGMHRAAGRAPRRTRRRRRASPSGSGTPRRNCRSPRAPGRRLRKPSATLPSSNSTSRSRLPGFFSCSCTASGAIASAAVK